MSCPPDRRSAPPASSGARRHVAAFDGVRGLLSLSIAGGHILRTTGWAPLHEPLRALRFSSYFSIEFLFLLGGFGALLPVASSGRMVRARTYALRRAGRIVPVYYLTIVLAVLLGGLLRPVTKTNFPHGPGAVLAHLAFVENEVYPFQSGFGVQGIVWTMSIVAVFYVVFALVGAHWVRHPYRWLAATILVAVVWRESTLSHPDWYMQFPLFSIDFGLGMTAAFVYVRLKRRLGDNRSRAATAVCGAAATLLTVLLYLSGLAIAQGHGVMWVEGAPLAVAVPFAFTVFLVALPFSSGAAQCAFTTRVVRWVGEISYALFLFHFLVIWLVVRFVHIPRNGALLPTLELAALVLPISGTLAWAATRWIERPLRGRAQRIAARLETSPPPPPRLAPVPQPASAE
jgi:peptidoglycan/LPS O-acetylase OafA/YrhL